jgi:pyruvate dehydrogenase E2 component (dihydrolipoamide acetyltransferase)
VAKQQITVPDLGGASDVEVIEICVAVGDEVEAEQSLVVLESDKASMEIPSPASGKVVSIEIAEGDTVNEGDLVLELESASASDEESQEPEPEEQVEEPAPEEEPIAAAPVVEKSAAPVAETSVETIRVPDLGGADNVEVIEVSVAAGDKVSEGDPLVAVESDKASMEIPAPGDGEIVSLKVSVGDQISAGDVIGEMTVAGAAAEPTRAPQANEEPQQEQAGQPAAPPVKEAAPKVEMPEPATVASDAGIYAGPAVRKLARELGVSLEQVTGSGPKGRIGKEDLQQFVKKRMAEPAGGKAAGATGGSGIPAVPEVDFAKFGEVTLEKRSKIHKVTASNMSRSWLNVPHVTQFDEADITGLEEFRASLKPDMEKRGTKLTPIPFLIKAVGATLRANPKFNASLHADGEHIVYKQYVHIGMAVDTPAGLVVPVIRDADQKSIWEIAEEANELAAKAKDKKLTANEMQGGCFTISSLGNIGGTGFTPIVNAPEVAILGVSRLQTKPIWNGAEFVPRKMLPLSLSYDHCAINGADAGRFMTDLVGLLADIRRMLL